MLRLLAVLALGTLTACGSVSKLQTDSAAARRQIGDYPRVAVIDFAATATTDAKDAEKQQAYAADLQAAQSKIADLIAAEITERKAFDEVSRTPLEGPHLKVSGTITRYEEGNVAARMVTGFAGQAHFEATVTVSDADSESVLGTFSIDRNSWPLPIGASTNAVQNVGTFMSGAAKRVADELAVARGKRSQREE
jgi:hypothetical protein